MQEASTHLPLALELAGLGRTHSLAYFRTGVEVALKADASPVTQADRETEAAMRALLAERAPAHGVLGEEYGPGRLEAEHIWVLDPIDGTKSFITGSPLWGVLVALLHRGRPVLGVVDMPVLGERWVGVAGHGASCNGRAVAVRDCRTLAQARIFTTSPDVFTPDEWTRFDALSRQCALRRFGGDCYAYAQLAAGHIDLVVEASLQPYDYLAPAALVQAAGGVMTDWSGQPLGLKSDGRVLAAATPQLHAAALARLIG